MIQLIVHSSSRLHWFSFDVIIMFWFGTTLLGSMLDYMCLHGGFKKVRPDAWHQLPSHWCELPMELSFEGPNSKLGGPGGPSSLQPAAPVHLRCGLADQLPTGERGGDWLLGEIEIWWCQNGIFFDLKEFVLLGSLFLFWVIQNVQTWTMNHDIVLVKTRTQIITLLLSSRTHWTAVSYLSAAHLSIIVTFAASNKFQDPFHLQVGWALNTRSLKVQREQV